MTERQIQKYIFLFLIFIFGIVIIYLLSDFIGATLGALVFYIIFRGTMKRLVENRKWNKSLAATALIILSFFIVVLPLTLMGILIGNKITYYISDPSQLNEIISMVTERIKLLPIELKLDQVIPKITENIGSLLTGLLNNVFGALTTIVIMYFLLYFFLISYGKLEKTIMEYIPLKESHQLMLGEELEDMTFSNAIGVPIIAIVQGLIAYVIYLITGVTDAGLWATLTGAASVIPLVGTAIIWVPVATIMLVLGNVWEAIFIAAGAILILGNLDNLIRLIIAKRMADVHPVVTLLGVFFGLNLFGLTGLIFGPLLISYFLIFLKIYKLEYARKPKIITTAFAKNPDEGIE